MEHALGRDQIAMSERGSVAGACGSGHAHVLRLRTVHRAAADLRRGTPRLLTGEAPLILLAAETAGPRGLRPAMLAAEAARAAARSDARCRRIASADRTGLSGRSA